MSSLFFTLMTLKMYHSGVKLKMTSHPYICMKRKQTSSGTNQCHVYVCLYRAVASEIVLTTGPTLPNANSSL